MYREEAKRRPTNFVQTTYLQPTWADGSTNLGKTALFWSIDVVGRYENLLDWMIV